VDHVVRFDSKDVVPGIRAPRPDVQVKGTDYTPETIPEAAEVRSYGGRVAVAGDPKAHSTTEVVEALRRMEKAPSGAAPPAMRRPRGPGPARGSRGTRSGPGSKKKKR
jgi:hypothetical protein